MIRNNTIKITLFYFLSISFVLLNIWYVVKKDFIVINALPFLLCIILFAIFSFDKIIYLIVFFAPLSIPLNKFVPGLTFDMFLPTEPLLFITLIIFILKMIHERGFDRKILFHPVSLIILLNLLWILITCFTSTMPFVSFKFFMARVWFVLVLYFLTVKLFSRGRNMEKHIWFYIIPFLFVIIYSIYRHFGYGLWDRIAAHFVVTPFYNDHTSYGAALAIYLPFLALFAFGPIYNSRLKFISSILFVIFLIGIVLSYSRAAWVSLFAGLVFWIIIKLKIPLRSIFTGVVLFLILLFTFQNSIVMYLERNSGESSSNLIEHVSSISNMSTDASNLERINRWQCAVRMFEEKPVIGHGPGTYMFRYAPYQLNSGRTIISTNAGDLGNAHSEYLGALAESGIMGMVTFVMIIIMVVYTALKVYGRLSDQRMKSIVLAALIGLVTYYIHGFLNNFLDTDKLSIPFWGFSGMIVAIDIYSKRLSAAS